MSVNQYNHARIYKGQLQHTPDPWHLQHLHSFTCWRLCKPHPYFKKATDFYPFLCTLMTFNDFTSWDYREFRTNSDNCIMQTLYVRYVSDQDDFACAEGGECPLVAAATWIQAGITTATWSISLRMQANECVSLSSPTCFLLPPTFFVLSFLFSCLTVGDMNREKWNTARAQIRK